MGVAALAVGVAAHSPERLYRHRPGPGSASTGVSGGGRAIGAIPGTMPTRLCTDNIYAGTRAASVVRTPTDIVVGPVRFGTLGQATGAGLYPFRTPDGTAEGIKSPMSVSGTTSRWIAVRVTGDGGQGEGQLRPGQLREWHPWRPRHGTLDPFGRSVRGASGIWPSRLSRGLGYDLTPPLRSRRACTCAAAGNTAGAR